MKPLHINKGKTIAQTISDRTDYADNPDKTRDGELVTGYQCDPHTADAEFLLAKQQYADTTGRDQGSHNVLAYHICQAFKPGEITPELANKLGYELAMRFTRGRHAFIVATHIDKHHVHNHIVFNSTTLDCTRKFDDPKRSGRIIRRISDQICLENGLSVIENAKLAKGHYGAWLGDKREPSKHEKLAVLIDTVLAKKPADFEVFVKLMQAVGCEVKRGKLISFRTDGQKGFIRLRSMPEDYKEDDIRERISGSRTIQPKRKPAAEVQAQKVGLLIDIQNSIKAQGSPGYSRWTKVFNLKQAAQTLIFLQENGLDDLEKLNAAAQKAKDDFNGTNARIQAIDKRLSEITALQKHIGAYSKTREVYAAYRKAGYSKKYLAEHEGDITAHKAAKAFFDSLGLTKLPTINMLKTEFSTLNTEKKSLYAGYQGVRKFMQKILTARQNAEAMLHYHEAERAKDTERS
jgi:hypothetical protein